MRLIYLLLLAKYNIVLQRQYKIPSPIFWYVFLSTSILHFTLSQLRNRFFGVRSLCLLECVVSYSQNTLSIDKLTVKNILYLGVLWCLSFIARKAVVIWKQNSKVAVFLAREATDSHLGKQRCFTMRKSWVGSLRVQSRFFNPASHRCFSFHSALPLR